MLIDDPSQRLVLALDPTRHARILGAPGTGKTAALVAAFVALLGREGWEEGDVLALAPNRLVSAALRARIEQASARAFGGTPVRTAASLAFAVLARASAVAGEEAPRLLTGTVQDEAIARVVAEGLSEGAGFAGLAPEVLQSPVFRAELRELWRIADDADREPAAFAEELAALATRAAEAGETAGGLPELALVERWQEGFALIAAVAARLAEERPSELSSSALLRASGRAVRRDGGTGEHAVLRVPRLILVDDAQELGEGELALLAAFAGAGSAVWAFGDPDLSTAAFHGERTLVMSRLAAELVRRGAPAANAGAGPAIAPEQEVVLGTAHRHGPALRGLLRELTSRIGAAGAGAQRAAAPAGPESAALDRAEFAVAASPAEQLGIIAHRLRSRHLGLGGEERVEWSEMAVLCRSRAEAARVARQLAAHHVPTGVAAGGLVLREHQLVHELVALLRHALGIRPLVPEEVMRLAGGVIGGLDPVAVRRLRGALLLLERREARAEQREPVGIDEVIAEAFAFPGAVPVVDSAGGRALRRIGLLAAAGARVHEAGGTAREALWAIWDGTGLAQRWQEEALEGRGVRADEAHRSLDAALGLFFALQRHEEQDSEQPVAELLEEILSSAVPEDTLAQRGGRPAVTITTPQGTIGREFGIVAVVGVQDGVWPNLKTRGSLLGGAALERWLQGGEAIPPSRRDTLHDELRLFAHSCARSRGELLVVAVSDEEQHPSPFFAFGSAHRVEGLPSSRLTLRGATATARRRLVADPADATALDALVALAEEGVPGAHPDDWYGVRPPSTTAPLVDLAGDPEAVVPVSPSQLERAEGCPLDWAIAKLGGSTGSVQASLGTLVHHALETAEEPDPERLLATVLTEWGKLPFDAEWESERAVRLAREMTRGLAGYLVEFDGSDRELVGTEAAFRIPIGRSVLRGVADRLERRETPDGRGEITVLDLKTGRTPPTRAELESHAQLQAYQLGVVLGAFAPGPGDAPDPREVSDPREAPAPAPTGAEASGGARLLYVHPDAAKGKGFVERGQAPITDELREEFVQRVADVATVMAAGEFTARVEHHCSDPHRPGDCSLHIIPAVSRA